MGYIIGAMIIVNLAIAAAMAVAEFVEQISKSK